MKISLADLHIILDTLLGSKGILDGGKLWKFSEETRDQTAKKLLREMQNKSIYIDVEN
jgi:hypothetical protein